MPLEYRSLFKTCNYHRKDLEREDLEGRNYFFFANIVNQTKNPTQYSFPFKIKTKLGLYFVVISFSYQLICPPFGEKSH